MIMTEFNGYVDTFDCWWDTVGSRLIKPKTPTSIVLEFRKLAEEAWNAGWIKHSNCVYEITGSGPIG